MSCLISWRERDKQRTRDIIIMGDFNVHLDAANQGHHDAVSTEADAPVFQPGSACDRTNPRSWSHSGSCALKFSVQHRRHCCLWPPVRPSCRPFLNSVLRNQHQLGKWDCTTRSDPLTKLPSTATSKHLISFVPRLTPLLSWLTSTTRRCPSS